MTSTATATRTKAGSLTSLKGVGPALAERLGRLNIETPGDLLFLLPQRYEDRTNLMPLGALTLGRRVVVEGEVELTEVVFRRRRTLLTTISDGTGLLTLRFFYFSRAQQNTLARGARVRCYGEVRKGPSGPEMIHPEYSLLRDDEPQPLEDELTPVYPTTEGLQQFRLRGLVDQALERYLPEVRDWLPAELIEELGLPSITEAIRFLHRPPPDADLAALAAGSHPCQRRLALEEMLAHHLSLRQVREQNKQEPGIRLAATGALRERFLQQLGFTLTGDQQLALTDIETDLAGDHPMMRLVQGDVGCGKTVVAAAAALAAVDNGYQVAIMAPTELLAEQHRDSFAKWFTPLGINTAWLSGSLRKKARETAYAAIASGEAQVIVGTHALFQAGVEYRNLALVIVDEQHRFGVHQRLQLMEKGRDAAHDDSRAPHQLVMTATPIPRTLAMTLYADLDTSIIRELPPGRQPIRTVALPEERRPEVVERVHKACSEGSRAYWVCPLVEDSELIESQAAESTHAILQEALADVRVGLIHGRMKADEKERAMQSFAAGDTQILVATTVIEVGVDVPEATLMIIENAERMGLSQLHQLRGRVGRGDAASSCVLLYRQPLSAVARQRLDVLRRTNDGFEVAQQDLELRGPGEVLGTRQTGLMQLRIADLIRDADLAPAVYKIARRLLETPDTTTTDPATAVVHPVESSPVDQIIRRWIGASARFGNV